VSSAVSPVWVAELRRADTARQMRALCGGRRGAVRSSLMFCSIAAGAPLSMIGHGASLPGSPHRRTCVRGAAAKVGQIVKAGDGLGRVGYAGYSSEPHLRVG
jgi:hypothetical protein